MSNSAAIIGSNYQMALLQEAANSVDLTPSQERQQGGAQRALGQYMTPFWAAEALIQRTFPNLDSSDSVIEMTCGTGPFLSAIPAHVRALGIEIDPRLAEIARRNSGRRVITGDFREVARQLKATVVVGNPPFKATLVAALLDVCRQVLPEGARAAFILPAYILQTPSSTMRYNANWSIQAEMLPKTLFPGLHCPLSWVVFCRDAKRHLIGMALYQEAADVATMPREAKDCLKNAPGTWSEVVSWAIDTCGGRANLEAIYNRVEPKRPTGNPAWREQIRKVVRNTRRFRNVAPGVYANAA